MINLRLVKTVNETKKYIAVNVAVQWISLLANIVMMALISALFGGLYAGTARQQDFLRTGLAALVLVGIRAVCTLVSSRMSYHSSAAVKRTLREMIYKKLLQLGSSYREKIQTSEVVQVAVEGVEQLETYFASYLPQFFYAMLAPLTLFAVIGFLNVPAALVLFVCVPLIPIAIAAVQTWAKKLLSRYWDQYTSLGDTFLENLQGLTTLKIYQADGYKAEEMAEESEKFRRITMKVLTMQLNSITIMDVIAYGGAALGIIVAVLQMQAGKIDFARTMFIVLLSADFFIPMRMLGSFFHIAMNGMAASEKIFRLLDIPDEGSRQRNEWIGTNCDISCRDLRFSYDGGRRILKDINMEVPQGSFISIVGESGCGKSTFASILNGKNKNYQGSVRIGGHELRNLMEESLFQTITYVSHQSYLFKGTVRENLRMGDPDASDEKMWQVLEKVRLADFLREEQGLETMLQERASNLSGGQCQRLALARSLLHDTPVYIFDEATSNIDVESENDIMARILELAKTKTVILISHRLANVVHSQYIYVLKEGQLAEQGSHEKLLSMKGVYAGLWKAQQELEHVGKEEVK